MLIGFAARLAALEQLGILSLLCFIWAGRIPIAIWTGLLFVNFYIFIQQRFRADTATIPALQARPARWL